MVGNRVFSVSQWWGQSLHLSLHVFVNKNRHHVCREMSIWLAVLIKIQTHQKWIFGRTDLLINSIWFVADFNTTKQFWSQSTPLSFFGHLAKLNAGRNYFSCCVWSIGALNRNKYQRKRLRGTIPSLKTSPCPLAVGTFESMMFRRSLSVNDITWSFPWRVIR